MNDRPPPGSRYRHAGRSGDMTVPPGVIAPRHATPPPARRSALQWLPLALGSLVGVALVIVGLAIFSRQSATAQSPSVAPTAHQICTDLTAQRYDDLYTLLAQGQKSLGTSDQFAASQRQLDAQLGTVSACTYSVPQLDSTSATLTLTLTRGTSAATPGQIRLTLEQNVWRIADYDSSLVDMHMPQFSRVGSISNGG